MTKTMIQQDAQILLLSPLTAKPSTRAPLASIHSLYRSKIMTSVSGVNTLTACAAVLLSLACKLQETSSYQEIDTLYQNLVHEIKAFETQAQSKGYRAESILIARYLLCTFLDEAILNTPWGKSSGWENRLLLETFQNESDGSERFFIILERVSEEAALHIDLLELFYLCLSLGYEGKFHSQEESKFHLDKIMDELYQLIRFVRGDIKKHLLIAPPQNASQKPMTQPLPLWLILTLTCVLIFMLVAASTYLLNQHAALLFAQVTK